MVKTMEDIHPVISKSLIMRAAGHFLQRHMRRPDWLLEDVEKNRFVLVCPESNGTEVQKAVIRIGTLLGDHLGIVTNLGYAAFPDDAVTLEDIFSIAESRFEQLNNLQELEARSIDGSVEQGSDDLHFIADTPQGRLDFDFESPPTTENI
jgi:hypothetical protein